MDEIAMFGEVRDSCTWYKRYRKPRTPIGLFFEQYTGEPITHWCKKCRRWHGVHCFYADKETD
jgi:hypothetical protein